MPMTPQRILVVGAGVIGSVYATWLQQAGHRVTMLARGTRLVEVRAHGISTVDASTRQRLTIPIATVDHLAPEDAYDLLIVAVRLDQVSDLLPVIAATTAIPTVLFLLNNAFGVVQFAEALGRNRVVLGFPGIGGKRDGATVTFYVTPQQPTTLGEASGELTPRLRTLAALVTATGHRVALTTRMDGWLKTHAIFVTCMTAAIDQSGGDSVRLARDHARVVTMVRAICEGFHALRTLGVPITPQNLMVLFGWMPSWFAVRYWEKALRGPVGTLAIAPHARAARGEMALLADQVLVLLHPASQPTPTLDALLAVLTGPPEGKRLTSTFRP